LADTIVARSREAIEKSGFREYYHPYTGEGLGARDFGWSTLILNMRLGKWGACRSSRRAKPVALLRITGLR